MTHGVFRHANIALQRGPFPGQSAEKLLIIDWAATAVLKIYHEMNAEEHCVFPESAVKLFAMQVRSYAIEYPWAASVALLNVLLSPACTRMARQHATMF